MVFAKSVLLLGLLSSTAFAGLVQRSICQPGRRTINGQQYTVSCGIDRYGGDYDRLKTSFEGCISACGNDPVCKTAQYHESNGYCYLKNSVNPAVQEASHDTVDLGSGCASGTSTYNGVQCTVTCGVDRRGGDYSSSRTGNVLACAQACAADANCVTAQYNETNGYCYLKNADNGAESSTTTDSVVCNRV